MTPRTLLGMVLASPITMATLTFYVLPSWAFGWYRYHGWLKSSKSRLGVAPCWHVDIDRCPRWLRSYWSRRSGHCVGTAIVVKTRPGSSKRADATVIHELHHVDQVHRLGVFQPILYVAATICAWAAGEDPYVMNVFESAARRVSGQIVDGQSFLQGYINAKETSSTRL